MTKKIGELIVDKSEDFFNKMVKILEDAGYILVLERESFTDRHYIVAEKEDKE